MGSALMGSLETSCSLTEGPPIRDDYNITSLGSFLAPPSCTISSQFDTYVCRFRDDPSRCVSARDPGDAPASGEGGARRVRRATAREAGPTAARRAAARRITIITIIVIIIVIITKMPLLSYYYCCYYCYYYY